MYPPDVLPACVAEMDFPLAPPVREALLDGGRARRLRLPASRRRSARRSPPSRPSGYGWTVDPERVVLVPDVVVGHRRPARRAHGAGRRRRRQPAGVRARSSRRSRERRPPRRRGAARAGRRRRLAARPRRARAGVRRRRRVYLLCNPHNPTGRVLTRDELAAVAELADAPRRDRARGRDPRADGARRARRHVPYVTLGDEAAAHGLVLASASKAWNIAGLKCAVVVSGSEAGAELAARLSPTPAVPRRPLRRARVGRRVPATAARGSTRCSATST